MNEERCKRLEERQAALEQRVGAAIDVAIATLRDEIGVEDALDRLAALRSPGVAGPNAAGIAAALSTWQAERLANEALAGGPPPPHDCGDGPVNDEPGATTWRGLVDAKEAEIADLRERVAHLEARDREGRWLLTRSEWSPNNSGTDLAKIGWTQIEDEYDDRRAAYLSGTVPPDPARGLIEWLVAAYDGCSRRGTIEECSAQERAVYDAIRDLRAHLGGGT